MKIANRHLDVDSEVEKLYVELKDNGKTFLRTAHRLGTILNRKKESFDHGDWLPWLTVRQIPVRSAQTYMKFSTDYSLEDLKLIDGTTLAALYRGAGQMKELEGGGARNGKAEKPGPGQLFFDFGLFDGFMRVIEARQDSNPFDGVDLAELQQTRARTSLALQLMDAKLTEIRASTTEHAAGRKS